MRECELKEKGFPINFPILRSREVSYGPIKPFENNCYQQTRSVGDDPKGIANNRGGCAVEGMVCNQVRYMSFHIVIHSSNVLDLAVDLVFSYARFFYPTELDRTESFLLHPHAPPRHPSFVRDSSALEGLNLLQPNVKQGEFGRRAVVRCHRRCFRLLVSVGGRQTACRR